MTEASVIVVGNSWRHICPKAPSFEVSVSRSNYKNGRLLQNVEIPRHSRIQGADPRSDLFSGLFGAQRAFMCSWIAVTQPSLGTLELSGIGWFYVITDPIPTGTIQDPTTDSFQYTLSLNGETSPPGTISFKFT